MPGGKALRWEQRKAADNLARAGAGVAAQAALLAVERGLRAGTPGGDTFVRPGATVVHVDSPDVITQRAVVFAVSEKGVDLVAPGPEGVGVEVDRGVASGDLRESKYAARADVRQRARRLEERKREILQEVRRAEQGASAAKALIALAGHRPESLEDALNLLCDAGYAARRAYRPEPD